MNSVNSQLTPALKPPFRRKRERHSLVRKRKNKQKRQIKRQKRIGSSKANTAIQSEGKENDSERRRRIFQSKACFKAAIQWERKEKERERRSRMIQSKACFEAAIQSERKASCRKKKRRPRYPWGGSRASPIPCAESTSASVPYCVPLLPCHHGMDREHHQFSFPPLICECYVTASAINYLSSILASPSFSNFSMLIPWRSIGN
jgi:hypothetical protein